MWTYGSDILSRPEVEADQLAALPRLPLDAEGPVFAEPWEAQAFAMAVQLNRQGVFTWTEWAAALSEQLKGSDDDGSHYYEHWLAALESLVMARGLAGAAALDAHKHAWVEAYRRTPHGKPVAL
jgi:nitrile hydratase accessory protein